MLDIIDVIFTKCIKSIKRNETKFSMRTKWPGYYDSKSTSYLSPGIKRGFSALKILEK